MNYNQETMIFTVSQINEYVKMLLESSPVLTHVSLRGEISNFTNHTRTGHFYFSLKDEGGLIRAVMFRSNAEKLQFVPENGMKVLVRGRVSAYVRDGQYQFYADSMEPDGLGALAVAYEQLKNKLEAEGLFLPERKKPLPEMPMTVGVITSPTGAAVRDIINILSRRFPLSKMVLFPALVQGENAPRQLISGIRYFNRTHSADVIIIGRGGGSIEDLWAFNNEQLAREIADSTVPVISAVGHETDYTICDFVADLRAPTPSAAAELAVPDAAELKQQLRGSLSRMTAGLSSRIGFYRDRVKRLSDTRALSSPYHDLEEKRIGVKRLEKELLLRFSSAITGNQTVLEQKSQRLQVAMQRTYELKKHDFIQLAGKLDAYSPMAVFGRGYSIVSTQSGKRLTDIKQLKPGTHIVLRTVGGNADATVDAVHTEN